MSADVVNHLDDCSRDYFKCHEAACKDPVKPAAFWQPRMNEEHVTPLSAILIAMYDCGKNILEFGKESAESYNVYYFLNSTLVPKIKIYIQGLTQATKSHRSQTSLAREAETKYNELIESEGGDLKRLDADLTPKSKEREQI